MTQLNSILENQRIKFRECFNHALKELQARIDDIKPKDVSGDIFDAFADGSAGRLWQKTVLEMLEKDISKDVYLEFQKVLKLREESHCVMCGSCCRLACSEFSPEELKVKAQNGDNFATQFLSVFVPYETKEDARKIYPEYIELLEQNEEQDVYFYHCPKVTDDNKCSDYENRPKICSDFPDNPLVFLPQKCGFCEWKNKVEDMTLLLHAMMDIIEYYKSKIPKY